MIITILIYIAWNKWFQNQENDETHSLTNPLTNSHCQQSEKSVYRSVAPLGIQLLTLTLTLSQSVNQSVSQSVSRDVSQSINLSYGFSVSQSMS